MTALADIRAAVGPDYPLFFDTGLRGGEEGPQTLRDVLKSVTSITLAQIEKTSLTDH